MGKAEGISVAEGKNSEKEKGKELVFPQESLARIMRIAGAFSSTIAPYTSQSFMRVQIQPKQVIFEGFGEESGVRYFYPFSEETIPPGEIEEREYYVVTGGLRELIEKMEDPVVLDASKKEEMVIRSGKSKYTTRALNPEEFPEFPYEYKESEVKWSVGADILRRALRKTIFPLGSEQNIEYASVFALHFAPKEPILSDQPAVVRMVTTDAFRLALYEIPLMEKVREEKYFFDGNGVKYFHRILADTPEPVEMYLYEKYGACVFPQMQYYINQVQRNFPEYEVLLGREMPNRVIFDRQTLMSRLQRVDIWAKMQTRPHTVLFTFHPDYVEISTEPEQVGPAYEEVPCQVQGTPKKLALNSRYILEYLSTLDSEKVVFLYKDATSVCCWYPEDEVQSRYYVMPVRHAAVEE